MTINAIASETSLKARPQLRRTLIFVWALIVGYTVAIFILAAMVSFDQQSANQSTLMGVVLDTFLTIFNLSVDVLIGLGFTFIAFHLFARRSDDWMALFTSMFLVVFSTRISSLINYVATVPSYKMPAEIILALGDSGIVLFALLFPNGKAPHKFFWILLPLGVTMFGLYLVPASPIYWQILGLISYISVLLIWYGIALVIFGYRYFFQATPLQKQQIRYVLVGLMGPLAWFLLFNLSYAFFGDALTNSQLTAAVFQVLSRIFSIFLFMLFPFSLTLSITRSRLFDIDLLINRSLVYVSLTAGLGLIFATLLGLASLIFRTIHPGDQSMLALTISAIAAGALFQPARRKLQRFVDQFFYHIKIDYEKTPVKLQRNENSLNGETLSSYRELKLIGRGGMADVYRAENPTNGKPVAIKVLSPSLAIDEQFRRRFLREAEAITSLEHPNIVHVLHYGEENNTYYIVMEYLTGPDIRNLLKEVHHIELADALPMLREVASALDYAHSHGLVHRDIKPSNVMLDSSRLPTRAVLTDFGIAKIADAHTKITVTGVLGTFDYIAPEQIQSSGEVTASADLYALGVMTYQMLTGHLPFERANTGALLLAHLTTPPPDAREIAPNLPHQTAYAIQRSMAKKPEDRYATANDFISALENT